MADELATHWWLEGVAGAVADAMLGGYGRCWAKHIKISQAVPKPNYSGHDQGRSSNRNYLADSEGTTGGGRTMAFGVSDGAAGAGTT